MSDPIKAAETAVAGAVSTVTKIGFWKTIGQNIVKFVKGAWKLISDPFKDKNNDWDEKRILGVGFLVGGFFYAVKSFGPVDTSVLTILIGTGISLLGGAIVGDVNNPPKSGS